MFARIVAIPDIHGDLHHYRESLSLAGVATEDASIEWTAGDTTHFVQTGDIVDRGEHSLLVMDMLANLTSRARKAGGKVTALMGNHELMSGLMDDTRYVNKEEILLMGRKELDAMRELGGERMGTSYGISAAWQTGTRAWIKAFDPDAKRGRRLRDRRPMATVAGEGFCKSLFAHAGVRSRHLARHGDGIGLRWERLMIDRGVGCGLGWWLCARAWKSSALGELGLPWTKVVLGVVIGLRADIPLLGGG